ncbi:hypothetical protein SAURM35S_03963 [Streptomyces aurantiogriseus]
MRGRTFRRPLTTTRDGRTRGRGGRHPGDDSLTCPPVAAAHRSTARGSASAGRSAPAAHLLGASRRPGLRQGSLRRGHGGRRRRLAHPQRPDRRRHPDRVRHGDQQRQAGGHRRARGSPGGRRADDPLGDRQRGQAGRRSLRPLGGRGGRQVHRQVRPAHAGRRPALQHLRTGRRARPGGRRGLPRGRLPLGRDRREAVGAGDGRPADVPAVAARGGGHRDEDDRAVAAGLHGPHDGGDRFQRAADACLPQ